MPLDRILDAQTKSEKAGENPDQVKKNHQEFNATGGDPNSSIFAQIVEFAKNLPLFSDLKLDTQVMSCIMIKKKNLNFFKSFLPNFKASKRFYALYFVKAHPF